MDYGILSLREQTLLPDYQAYFNLRWVHRRLIGQKELVKTAITLENSMCIAVLSCLKQDIPWTKRVGKICGNS